MAELELRAPLFEDKVVDFILDLATVSERSVSPEELQQEQAAGQAEARSAAKAIMTKATKAKA